jgi:hypothetical protein
MALELIERAPNQEGHLYVEHDRDRTGGYGIVPLLRSLCDLQILSRANGFGHQSPVETTLGKKQIKESIASVDSFKLLESLFSFHSIPCLEFVNFTSLSLHSKNMALFQIFCSNHLD